ncbi:MAG TPA: hypothetical protein VF516_41470, partial [Kofleriaceae bacterium]
MRSVVGQMCPIVTAKFCHCSYGRRSAIQVVNEVAMEREPALPQHDGEGGADRAADSSVLG